MRKIEALTDHEHLLLRPNLYVGSVELLEDKIIIYDEIQKCLIYKQKIFSEGFYRILDEVIDNAFDEAKRCFSEGYEFKKITVDINSKTNLVSVTDSGRGFINGSEINSKTGLTNIETALTKLRAGSNFRNEDFDVNLIGMNGIGVSATNILSDYFEIETLNTNHEYYKQSWKEFVENEKKQEVQEQFEKSFTKITFQPRKKIFKKSTWDYEIVLTKLLLKRFEIKNDISLKDIDLEFIFDGKLVDLDVNIIPENSYELDINPKIKLFIWSNKNLKNSAKISFINSSQCVGFHQTYIEEFIDKKVFDKEIAHDFYRTLVLINLKPKYVQFQEQNKTRFVTNRFQLEKILPLHLKTLHLNRFKDTLIFQEIEKEIELFEKKNFVNKIKNKQRKQNLKFSEKFYPSKKLENLFICEGLSAIGSISQKRNPETDSLYALTGKIKNTRSLSDLSENKAILELINILGLNIDDKGQTCKYKKIIIAADSDYDGFHIASLLINFFYKWFPNVIINEKLYNFKVPLLSAVIEGKIQYFYNLKDFDNNTTQKKQIRYLKGLGSLSITDWESIFKNMVLDKILKDDYSDKMMEIAFSNDSSKRKKWLSR